MLTIFKSKITGRNIADYMKTQQQKNIMPSIKMQIFWLVVGEQ